MNEMNETMSPSKPRPRRVASRRPRAPHAQDSAPQGMHDDHADFESANAEMNLEEAKEKKLRIIPLGGFEEVGKNCLAIEYDNQILVIDLGLMFPNEDMPGIDYVVPDTAYLQKNKDRIKGIVITHGHLDHIGAIPYLIRKLDFPAIYATALTAGLIKERLEEFKLERQTPLHVFHPDDTLTLGCFKITFFLVNHNIPDAVGVAVHTPLGLIVNSCDFKFDFTPVDQKPAEIHKMAALSGMGVLALLSDSTNAPLKGKAMSEREIGENLTQVIREAKGRVIMSTFASLISRIQETMNAAIICDRRIAVSGLSMEKNIELALRLGYLKMSKNVFIRLAQIDSYADDKIIIISTGSQGQENSSLSRMSRGEHRQIKIKLGDTVILSSSPIPGNERAVQNLMNSLFKLGAKVIYNQIFGVHVSGHGHQEDLKLMIALIRPKYFIPIHGERYMLERHSQLAHELGIEEDRIFKMGNGNILEFTKDTAKVSKIKIPINYVMVDGLGVGDIGNVVLRDRQVMAQDGMFVIIVTIDNQTQKIIGEPDIISRGFIYMKGNDRLIQETKDKTKQIINSYNEKKIEDWTPIRTHIRDDIGAYLFQKTERRPMILPVVIKV